MGKLLKYIRKQKTVNDNNFFFYELTKMQDWHTMLLQKQLTFFLTRKQCAGCRDIHMLQLSTNQPDKRNTKLHDKGIQATSSPWFTFRSFLQESSALPVSSHPWHKLDTWSWQQTALAHLAQKLRAKESQNKKK